MTPIERAEVVLRLAKIAKQPEKPLPKSPSRKRAWAQVCSVADREVAICEIVDRAPALAADVVALTAENERLRKDIGIQVPK